MADPVVQGGMDIVGLLAGSGGIGVSSIAAYALALKLGIIKNGERYATKEKQDQMMDVLRSGEDHRKETVHLLSEINTNIRLLVDRGNR